MKDVIWVCEICDRNDGVRLQKYAHWFGCSQFDKEKEPYIPQSTLTALQAKIDQLRYELGESHGCSELIAKERDDAELESKNLAEKLEKAVKILNRYWDEHEDLEALEFVNDHLKELEAE